MKHRSRKSALTVFKIRERLIMEEHLPPGAVMHTNERISAGIRYGEALLRYYGVSS